MCLSRSTVPCRVPWSRLHLRRVASAPMIWRGVDLLVLWWVLYLSHIEVVWTWACYSSIWLETRLLIYLSLPSGWLCANKQRLTTLCIDPFLGRFLNPASQVCLLLHTWDMLKQGDLQQHSTDQKMLYCNVGSFTGSQGSQDIQIPSTNADLGRHYTGVIHPGEE